MPYSHLLAETTRTVELQQIHEISRRLADLDRPDITAEMLGLAGKQTPPRSRPYLFGLFETAPLAPQKLRATAVLDHVSAEGCPAFPYVKGHFPSQFSSEARSTRGPDLTVDLHTEALRRLSEFLGLRHRWGVTSVVR